MAQKVYRIFMHFIILSGSLRKVAQSCEALTTPHNLSRYLFLISKGPILSCVCQFTVLNSDLAPELAQQNQPCGCVPPPGGCLLPLKSEEVVEVWGEADGKCSRTKRKQGRTGEAELHQIQRPSVELFNSVPAEMPSQN